ncbi:MAG TPA: SIS domain-containing protein [Thermoleophilia bacterium]|nr:SIS domain-containing protein [Thermoleophilia bacterium]
MSYAAKDLELLESDIRRQGALLAESLPWFDEVTAEAAARLGPAPTRVYLVGCGDSYDAAWAARFLWERLLGIPTEAAPALTFARYLVEAAPGDAVVVVLSQSGAVSRVVEAARSAAARGLRAVVVTGVADSPLGRERAAVRLVTPFPKLGSVPGTASYLFNLTLLYSLGMALAAVWAATRPDTAALVAATRAELERLPVLIDAALDRLWDVAREHAAATGDRRPVHLFLGAGPNLATARYAARKCYEILQLPAMVQETEEYAHDQIGLVGPGTPCMLFAPAGAADSRNREILASLAALRVPVAVVGDRRAADVVAGEPVSGGEGSRVSAPDGARWLYALPAGLGELVSPLLQAVPAQLYVCELARLVGGSFYGYGDPVLRGLGDALIYESEVARP